ncbi:MAG: ATP-binding protein [Burkholderiales bacterium]|nr:ATP-binding protein [Burkholderiales bacterium]
MTIARTAANLLARLARGFPVIAIAGPRQSGKSTLAREVFAQRPYVTLEDPDTRALALADPRRFLARFSDGAVLDEVQRAPELLSYLQGRVDANQRMGEFIVTGSQQFGLMDGITQSLAGRVGMLQLLPLSNVELLHSASAGASLEERMWLGGYPALHAQFRELQPQTWFASYVATYLERDVRQLLNVSNLALFQRFVLMCAARSGQLLNLSSLAADCGISQPTARQWLTVLQASYVVTLLPPYHRNFGKRLVKTPKLYFLDTGLLCHLLRVADALALQTHAQRGAIFETWVVTEVIKHRYNQGLAADLYFWRDNHGVELDLVYEDAGRLQAVEIKSGTTFAMDWLAGARRWKAMAGADAAPPIVLYGGAESFELADARVVSWREIGAGAGAAPQPPSTRRISRP